MCVQEQGHPLGSKDWYEMDVHEHDALGMATSLYKYLKLKSNWAEELARNTSSYTSEERRLQPRKGYLGRQAVDKCVVFFLLSLLQLLCVLQRLLSTEG